MASTVAQGKKKVSFGSFRTRNANSNVRDCRGRGSFETRGKKRPEPLNNKKKEKRAFTHKKKKKKKKKEVHPLKKDWAPVRENSRGGGDCQSTNTRRNKEGKKKA